MNNNNKMKQKVRILKPKRYYLLNQSQIHQLTFKKRQLSQPHLLSGNIIQKNKEIITSFIDRNYYSPQRMQKHYSFSLITSDKLGSMLYTMKNYYNYLRDENKQTLGSIEAEMKTNEKLLGKETELRDSRDFSINTAEKISVLNSTETVDQVRYRIEKLEDELNELKSKYKNVGEYTSTINYLIDEEKSKLATINDDIIFQENKLKEIEKANRVLETNTDQKKLIKTNSMKYLMTIDDELNKVNELMYKQEMKKKRLQSSMQKKTEYFDQMKNSYYKATLNQKEQFAMVRSKRMNKLRDIEEYQIKRSKKEKKYISLILGLLIIQRYFLDSNNHYSIDVKALRSSKEYTLLFSDQYLIKKNTYETNQTMTTIPTKSSQKNRQSTLNIDELIHQFNSLNVDADQLKRYYQLLLTNEQFTCTKMIELNEKVLELSALKDKHTVKVNEIIAKDYKNFKDLIKCNKKFANFVQSNNKRCQTANIAQKKQREHTYNLISSLLDDDKNNHPDQKEIKQNENKFIVKSHHYINSIKDAFDSLMIYFKECNFFHDIDMSSSASASNASQTVFPIKQNIISSIDSIMNTKQKEISREDDVMKLLTYAKNKIKSQDAKFILNAISHSQNSLNQFLNSTQVLETSIFHFYSNVKAMKNIIQIIESIIKHYISASASFSSSSSSQSVAKINSPQFNKVKQILSSKELVFIKSNLVIDDEALTYNFKRKNEKDSLNNTKDLSSSGYPVDNSIENKKGDQNNDDYKDSFIESKPLSSKRPVTSKMTLSNSITMKLFEPALRKSSYIRRINEGLDNIKQDTNVKRKYEFNINKERKSFNKLKQEIYPYNNPKINVDLLSNETYKFFSSQILEITKNRNITSGKR